MIQGADILETKECNKCKMGKPLSSYYKDPDSKDGRGDTCRSCLLKDRENKETKIRANKTTTYVSSIVVAKLVKEAYELGRKSMQIEVIEPKVEDYL